MRYIVFKPSWLITHQITEGEYNDFDNACKAARRASSISGGVWLVWDSYTYTTDAYFSDGKSI